MTQMSDQELQDEMTRELSLDGCTGIIAVYHPQSNDYEASCMVGDSTVRGTGSSKVDALSNLKTCVKVAKRAFGG